MKPWLYPLLSCLGLLLSATLAQKLLRPATDSEPRAKLHPHWVFAGALFGALLGAKLGYLLAEWLPLRFAGGGVLGDSAQTTWSDLLFGRSVLGALLGGYGGVELAKWRVGYRTTTGDTFALLAPISIGLGRVGCVFAGCCLGTHLPESSAFAVRDAHGVARWPAALVELGFNLVFVLTLVVYLLWSSSAHGRRRWLQGQLFHVYLMCYGAFRIWHETRRQTPELFGSVSGYQLLAGLVWMLGLVRFIQRRRARLALAPRPTEPEELKAYQ